MIFTEIFTHSFSINMRTSSYKKIFLLLVAVYACSGFVDTYAKAIPQTESSCTPDTTIKYGQYLIYNNAWNAPKNFSQCIALTKNKTPQIQWSWNYPNDNAGINGFPSILVWQSPWSSRPTTTKKLPVALQNIKSLKAEYQVVQNITWWYNLAIDGWITQSLVMSPENIKYEYMIWEDYSDIEKSELGSFQWTIKTTHGEYSMYTKIPTWNPPGTSWVYILFLSSKKHTSGTIDIDQLLNFAVDKKIIPKNFYLSTVEFGNEVTAWSGSTLVKKYDLNIQIKK